LSLAHYHHPYSATLSSQIFHRLPHLEILDLSFCTWITPSILISSIIGSIYNDDYDDCNFHFWQEKDDAKDDHVVPQRLQMISLYGCPHFYNDITTINLTQQQLGSSIPQLSIQHQKKSSVS